VFGKSSPSQVGSNSLLSTKWKKDPNLVISKKINKISYMIFLASNFEVHGWNVIAITKYLPGLSEQAVLSVYIYRNRKKEN